MGCAMFDTARAFARASLRGRSHNDDELRVHLFVRTYGGDFDAETVERISAWLSTPRRAMQEGNAEMTFEEILDQALDMLRRRGRVTYGALKRQFALDDAYVADLKDAMLYADSHVVDDAGRGLRWTGEPLSTAQRAFEGVGRFYGEAGVLWLVRALLQHEGRVSYRTLRQVFGFDEARLADVRAELLFTRCAIDEDGQGLVWRGRASADSVLGETTDVRLPATSDSAVYPLPAPSRGTPEAERRQLTVLFGMGSVAQLRARTCRAPEAPPGWEPAWGSAQMGDGRALGYRCPWDASAPCIRPDSRVP